MHVVQDGLDVASNELDQVLKDQSKQVDLVTGLDMVHKLVVNLAYRGVLLAFGSEAMRYKEV